MRLAIIERIENYEKEVPFNERYYLDCLFPKILDELNILLIPVISEKKVEEIASLCDGLIVTGSGNDVHPKYYGQDPIEGKNYKYDEYPLVKKIVELFSKQNKPILGICAGLQEINVIFGGTLFQEIPNHKLTDMSKHPCHIQKNSFLYEVYQQDQININSYHRQAIQNLAPGFSITARGEDGIIEGIEKGNIVALQWHPEVLYDRTLFETFIKKFLKKEI